MVEWLIKWKNALAKEATWKNAQKIEANFPDFDPWGQGSFGEGSTDTSQLSVMDQSVQPMGEATNREGRKQVKMANT